MSVMHYFLKNNTSGASPKDQTLCCCARAGDMGEGVFFHRPVAPDRAKKWYCIGLDPVLDRG
jgi:hypothetical protein